MEPGMDKQMILDPSDKFRPEKDEETFRDFTNKGVYYDRVRNVYHNMHTYQTYEFALEKVIPALKSWFVKSMISYGNR